MKNKITVTTSLPANIVQSVLDEIERAKVKHPNWPSDILYRGAIVAEEAGELLRACNQATMEEGKVNEAYTEAVQTAATAMRFLEEFKTATI